MIGANIGKNPVDIGRACMPLVRLLMQDGLTWSDREKIAEAIQNNLRVYADHQAEQRHIHGMVGGAAAQWGGRT